MSKVFGPLPDAMITMRLPAAEKDKLVQAAVVTGRNLTGFMRIASTRLADEILAEQKGVMA
jgi:uncharacterized protein (DUF1778 family)